MLYKHSDRPDDDCIYYFSQRRAQNANLVFHHSSSDATVLYDNMPASALEKVDNFAGDVLFENPDFDKARRDSSRQN